MKKNITLKELWDSSPKPTVNKELDKLSSKVLFPGKLELANNMLSKTKFIRKK